MKGRLLVVGGTGLVGDALTRVWRARGGRAAACALHCSSGPDLYRLDMRDEPAVRALLEEVRPDCVAVPAANPFVDYCELHPEQSRAVNVEGTLNVVRGCAAKGLPLLFYSSDYVFDGRKDCYREEDPVSPLNEYGRQKAEVEAAVLSSSARNLVIRTAGAYGWQRQPKNLVLQVLANLRAGRPQKAARDIRFSPTYVENLAAVSADLLEAGRGGLFHAAGADFLSRADFARLIAETFGLEASLIKEVCERDFPRPAKRPAEALLATDKVKEAAATPLWGARRGLEHMRNFEAEWRAYARLHLPAKSGTAPG